ncbi:DnaT-like ssDNA-binding protein [Sinorhizobium meliloti]|uniref:DnaT-like ssDNA-binding protein n=1 Tax=Rhizobium meliloti TaxID=382 RepID=UPI0039894232
MVRRLRDGPTARGSTPAGIRGIGRNLRPPASRERRQAALKVVLGRASAPLIIAPTSPSPKLKPPSIETATYALALAELLSPRSSTPTLTLGKSVKRQKVGSIEREFFSPKKGVPITIESLRPVLTAVEDALRCLLTPDTSKGGLSRWSVSDDVLFRDAGDGRGTHRGVRAGGCRQAT